VGYLTLAKVFAMCAWDHTIGILRDSTADDQRAFGRTILYSAAAIVATTLLLLFPIARRHRASLSPEQMAFFPQLLTYLVPSQLALTLPIGCSFGILYGLRGLVVSLRSKVVVLAFAIACTAATFVTVAWLLPAANQGFRELAYAEQVKRGVTLWLPPKGVPEMTFRELTQHIDTARRDGLWRVVRLSSYNYHLRWALPGATLALALFSLSLVTRRRNGRFFLGAVATVAFFCYWVLLVIGRALAVSGMMPPAPAAWMANIALALVTLALLKLPPRSVLRAGV
jgi:lipopolysaccharide export LptBFGC system permease protein LptF